MIRPPNTVDGILTDEDYKLMVGLTDALPNPPNYPTAGSMSGLLESDVVLIDDMAEAFFAVHRNVRRKQIIGRYLLPRNLSKSQSWALLRAVCLEIAERWPETLEFETLMPFTARSNARAATDSTKRFFDSWLLEKPTAVEDSDLGWALRWARFSDLVKTARDYDGP